MSGTLSAEEGLAPVSAPKLLIIDTDPGVDDAMAILMAANSPEVRLVGLTTVYGNVPVSLATANALRLVELAALKEVVVAQGAARSLAAGQDVERIADFVHGADGFGDVGLPPPQRVAAPLSAAEFIVHTVAAHPPGSVTLLALGPLTNVAAALQLDPRLGDKWAELVVLGGAFFCNGNVNPAAEANMYGDPAAADAVLGAGGPRVRVVGLDVTQRCKLTAEELRALHGAGRHGSFVSDISHFYLNFHKKWYGMDAIFLHDPAAMAAVLRPDLFTWRAGAVRVATEGVTRGHTCMDASERGFHGEHGWEGRPAVAVALEVQAHEVVQLIRQRLTAGQAAESRYKPRPKGRPWVWGF